MCRPSILGKGSLGLGGDVVVSTEEIIHLLLCQPPAEYTYSFQGTPAPPLEEGGDGDGGRPTKPKVAMMGSSSSWVMMGLKVLVNQRASFFIHSLIHSSIGIFESEFDVCFDFVSWDLINLYI